MPPLRAVAAKAATALCAGRTWCPRASQGWSSATAGLDDGDVSIRKISDQLGHSRVSMTQDRYLGRKLTDRHTAEVLEKLLGYDEPRAEKRPKSVP